MLRNRILAAATAAVLMLGMSVGGAGAALASTEVVEPVLESTVETVVEPISEAPLAPAVQPEGVGQGGGGGGSADSPCNFEEGFGTGTKYTPGGGSGDDNPVAVSGTMTFEWGTISWTQYQLVFTANPGWTVDLCVKGGSTESNAIELDSGSVTIDRDQSISHFMWANPSFTAPVASASIVVEPRDCFDPTTWNFDTDTIVNATWGEPFVEDGLIKIVATATGGALFAGGGTTKTFTATFEPAGGDDCVAPAIGVTADAAKITCDTDGWFRFGPGIGVSDDDAARIVWTVGPAAYAGDTETNVQHPVSEAVTITVTASLDEESEGDFALSDESGDGVVDPETGDITYTFIFTLPEDCELGSVVVPEVTKVDECIPDDELELDLVPSATPVASFTVTASPNVSYTYTINGGSPIAVVFPDGESTVTIPVTPGDTVIVTAVAASGYSLPEGYEPWEHTFDGSEACIDLPELANWPVSASATNQVCTPTGSLTSGSITVVFPVGPIENPNPVRYFIAFGTPQQQELTSPITAVAPGSYVVTAIPRVSTDSVGDGGLRVDIPLTVGAAIDDDCELDTLAFTGVGAVTNWLGVIAVLLTVAGMGFVLRRHRVEV